MSMHAFTLMHKYAFISMHMHAYACITMHMHAYACMHIDAYACISMPMCPVVSQNHTCAGQLGAPKPRVPQPTPVQATWAPQSQGCPRTIPVQATWTPQGGKEGGRGARGEGPAGRPDTPNHFRGTSQFTAEHPSLPRNIPVYRGTSFKPWGAAGSKKAPDSKKYKQ